MNAVLMVWWGRRDSYQRYQGSNLRAMSQPLGSLRRTVMYAKVKNTVSELVKLGLNLVTVT